MPTKYPRIDPFNRASSFRVSIHFPVPPRRLTSVAALQRHQGPSGRRSSMATLISNTVVSWSDHLLLLHNHDPSLRQSLTDPQCTRGKLRVKVPWYGVSFASRFHQWYLRITAYRFFRRWTAHGCTKASCYRLRDRSESEEEGLGSSGFVEQAVQG